MCDRGFSDIATPSEPSTSTRWSYPKTASRQQLITAAYRDHRVVSDRTVDSHIKNLRRKLADAGIDPIASVYGIGFFVAQGGHFPVRARGPVNHYMTFAGQLRLCVSVSAAVALQAKERRWRLGALASAAIGTLALVFTYTLRFYLYPSFLPIPLVFTYTPRFYPITMTDTADSASVAGRWELPSIKILNPAPKTMLSGAWKPRYT